MSTYIVFLGSSLSTVAGPTLSSPKDKGIAYYDARNDIVTASYNLGSGFNGKILMQGSLVEEPLDSDWSDVVESVYDCRLIPSVGENKLLNFKGNFVWMRAIVTEYTTGSIQRVSISY